jgi:LysR family hydrogen peroxide-inducible transcriptional activator
MDLPASALPTLRQLQFLTALQAHGSFVKAAEAVGVTQPTLSAGIKELETALEAVLVERGRAGAILTPAGEAAAARAVQLLADVEALVHAARGANTPFTGRFRLGAIPTIAPFILPRALPMLRARYPNMQLMLREDITHRLIEGLRSRTLDAAIIALPFAAPDLETAVVAEDEFLFLGPRGHPMADRNDLAPEHLRAEELLLLDDGHCLRDHALSLCGSTPGARAAEVSATSLHTLVHMVAGGMGVTLLPKLAADGGAVSGAPVTLRPFADPVIGRAIGVAWRAGGSRQDEARALVAVLAEAMASLAAAPMAR